MTSKSSFACPVHFQHITHGVILSSCSISHTPRYTYTFISLIHSFHRVLHFFLTSPVMFNIYHFLIHLFASVWINCQSHFSVILAAVYVYITLHTSQMSVSCSSSCYLVTSN